MLLRVSFALFVIFCLTWEAESYFNPTPPRTTTTTSTTTKAPHDPCLDKHCDKRHPIEICVKIPTTPNRNDLFSLESHNNKCVFKEAKCRANDNQYTIVHEKGNCHDCVKKVDYCSYDCKLDWGQPICTYNKASNTFVVMENLCFFLKETKCNRHNQNLEIFSHRAQDCQCAKW